MLVSIFVTFASALTLTASLPAGAFVSDKGEVGASWGGYSASAGLGGILSGNGGAKGGLHAEAGTPNGHVAAAGLGGSTGGDGPAGGMYSFAQSGSSATSSSSVHVDDHKNRPTKTHGSLFDDIFNIPQSVLRSVNDLLNKRAQGSKVVNASSSASAASATTSDGGAAKNSINVSTAGHGPTKYDDIFNIPQSVLGAVNRLLNRL